MDFNWIPEETFQALWFAIYFLVYSFKLYVITECFFFFVIYKLTSFAFSLFQDHRTRRRTCTTTLVTPSNTIPNPNNPNWATQSCTPASPGHWRHCSPAVAKGACHKVPTIPARRHDPAWSSHPNPTSSNVPKMYSCSCLAS